MRGLRLSCQPWINPLSGEETVYPLAGDPISGEGWVDGISDPAGDRRMGITSGPFSMALGDTQEVVMALVGEIGSKGGQAYLQNISGMKNKAGSIKGFIKNKMAVYILTESTVSVLQESQLKAAYILFDPALTVSALQWEIISKPAGSNSTLSATSGDSVLLTPDQEGIYKVSVTVNTVEGFSASHTAEFYASADTPPVADFSLIPETIILGNSLLADASVSYDPEEDSLEFTWDIIPADITQYYGNTVAGTVLENGEKYDMVPTGTGEYTVNLSVSDSIYEDDTTRVFHVEPKMENISPVWSFLDTNWYKTDQYCFYENKLLMAIEPLDLVRVYDLQESNMVIERDLSIADPVRVYGIEDSLMYIGTRSSSASWGPGRLSIYQLEPDWEITPVLENYLPRDHRYFSNNTSGMIIFTW